MGARSGADRERAGIRPPATANVWPVPGPSALWGRSQGRDRIPTGIRVRADLAGRGDRGVGGSDRVREGGNLGPMAKNDPPPLPPRQRSLSLRHAQFGSPELGSTFISFTTVKNGGRFSPP